MRVWYIVRLSPEPDNNAEYQVGNLNALSQNCFNQAIKADLNGFLARCSPTLTLYSIQHIHNPSVSDGMRGIDVDELIRNSLLNT